AFRATKLAAYRTDITQGTTPIWQVLSNLNSAKSAYGSIVYSKAPAVLRQGEFYLGPDGFCEAGGEFVLRHAYSAADWHGPVGSFEHRSRRDLQSWAQAWVVRRGMPVVRLAWDTDSQGHMHNAALVQGDALNEGGVWPMRVQLVMVAQDGTASRMPVLLDAAR